MPDAPTPPATRRVALVHDFLLDLRGAERVFAEMCDLWPEAAVFTTVYDERGTSGRFAAREVQTSFLQRLHPSARTFRALAPLFPGAVESLDLSGYDLVVSSSSAWAHAVIADPGALHVCYCHNPFRYAWNERERTVGRAPDPVSRAMLRGWLKRSREWDWVAAQRPHRYIANSRVTQGRIRAYFGRASRVVHPPVDVGRFSPGRVQSHYAVVSELMVHKRIEPVIEAFNRLRRPLVIVGDGPAGRSLKRLAGPNITFAGRLTDTEVADVLRGARALIVPAVEEFGIVSVEAQASGRPVIARRAGGALETVLDGITGCFWDGDALDLARRIERFDDAAIDPARCRANAELFDLDAFRRGMLAEVARAGAETSGAEERRSPFPHDRRVRPRRRTSR